MAADVTIFAALLAGLVSFLSPCVLPLVPPYLVYLAGTSLERLAEAEPERGSGARRCLPRCLFVAGFSTVFVALGASASVIGGVLRFYSNELAIVAGIAIIVMGLHFLGLTPIALLQSAGAHGRAKAGRALGRLRDGARLRARLDALHRADPGGDPGGRRLQGHGCEGRGPAGGLLARARPAVHHRGASRSSRLRPSSRAFAPISCTWSG